MKKPMTRRQAAKLALATALPFGMFARENANAEGKKSKSAGPQFLFVQNAKKVTFGDGKMTLQGVNPTTIFFSDRPERIAGHETTEHFVDDWSVGADSFASDNPNASVAFVGSESKEMADLVVELSNPVLKRGNLTYDIKILEGKAPKSGGAASLFIDVVGMPATPVSVAGVARRTTRRVVRRAAY